MSPSTASKFFHDEFGGYTEYAASCQDSAALVVSLKLLNGEYAPRDFLAPRRGG